MFTSESLKTCLCSSELRRRGWGRLGEPAAMALSAERAGRLVLLRSHRGGRRWPLLPQPGSSVSSSALPPHARSTPLPLPCPELPGRGECPVHRGLQRPEQDAARRRLSKWLLSQSANFE